MPRRPEPPDECSQCGAEVPRDAHACPDCGADEETGWNANPWIPGEGELDIPDYLIDDYDEKTDGPVLPGEETSLWGWKWLVATLLVGAFFLYVCLRVSGWQLFNG